MINDLPAGLAVPTTLGDYEVLRSIDSGGMGEVYEARDTRLERTIALKVIRRDVAGNPVRRQRLEREARVAAMLGHANIVTVHSLEECEGILFLTMELVDGVTLQRAIPAGGMPLEQCFRIAVQIADALAAAHALGIVHRDLKPSNVMITRHNVVKVLDFGLATSGLDAALRSPDTESLSDSGGPLTGTAAYMAPEVLEGSEATACSDLFSFGIVLFEMATGRRPFQGDTAAAVMSAILRDRPPRADDLRPAVPPELARLIDRCLAKLVEQRRQSAADLRSDLEDLERRFLSGDVSTRHARPRLAASLRRGALTTAIAAAAVAGIALWWRPATATPPLSRVVRFSLDLPRGQAMTAGFNSNVGISRDGRYVAFTPLGVSMVVRPIDNLEPYPLEGAKGPGFFRAPLFSPDGTSIMFISGDAIYSAKRQIRKAAVSGGAATTLFDYDMFHSGDWSDDGWIYWTAQYPGGIVRMRDSGGPIEPVTSLDQQRAERSHRFAHLLPDGQSLLYTAGFGGIDSYDDARIELYDLRTRTTKTLLTGGTSAVYSPSGHIVYARGGKLLAAPFDLARREITGGPFEVLSGVLMSTNTGAANFALSRRGDLAYVPGGVEGGQRTLVWVDRHGNEQPLPLPPASYLYPHLSPDGRTLAVEIEGPNHDFYVYDFERKVFSRMTTDGESHDPVWSPDGRSLAFRSWIAGGMTMWMMPADRSGPAVRLHPSGTRESPVSFSPDGRFLSFDAKDPETSDDARALAIDRDAAPAQIAHTAAGEGSAKFSPDGAWVAYSSDESGEPEVYVQAFPGPGPKIQISSAGGVDPVWRRAGAELYYRSRAGMMAVPYTASRSAFHPGAPTLLWKDEYSSGNGASCGMPGVSSSNYDVTPDGSRFLMVKEPAATDGTKVVVVLNWADQLASQARSRTASAPALR